ncbi:MAG TPA: VWA domain-containing protein [Vicinamibacterales bacterium]|nr:VWA domain-containing protein [Vicinamibacterales bacterium]
MRAFAILLAAFAGVLPQERQEPPQPLFRSSSSELVVLPVVVSSKHGTYVSDLPRERFAVFDNGRRVAIDFFSNEDTPVTIGLVVDASGSMGPKVGEVVAGAFAFARSSNPDDELFAMQFNDDVRDLLPDRRFLLASDHESLARALAAIRPIGRTALYDALDAALDRLDSGTRPRKALVVISDGGDNASRATLDSVLARARKSNAAIYTIGLFDEGDPDRNPRLLKQLAKTTGGERFLPESAGPLLTACEHIAREIRSGYTIGYAPPVRDGAFHRIRVVIDPPDSMHLDVRTRPGYFAGREGAQR